MRAVLTQTQTLTQLYHQHTFSSSLSILIIEPALDPAPIILRGGNEISLMMLDIRLLVSYCLVDGFFRVALVFVLSYHVLFCLLSPSSEKASRTKRLEGTKPDQTRQDKTRQDKARQDSPIFVNVPISFHDSLRQLVVQ